MHFSLYLDCYVVLFIVSTGCLLSRNCFRIYISKGVLGYNFYFSILVLWCCPKKMVCLHWGDPAEFQLLLVAVSLLHCRVESLETCHRSHLNAIFLPFHLPVPVPVPDIGHHILAIPAGGVGSIDPHLVIAFISHALEIPGHLRTVNLIYAITDWCAIQTVVALPPCARDRTGVVFVQVPGVDHVAVVVHVAREEMYLVGFQHFEQGGDIDRLRADGT